MNGVFRSAVDRRAAINRFIAEHNQNPRPCIRRTSSTAASSGASTRCARPVRAFAAPTNAAWPIRKTGDLGPLDARAAQRDTNLSPAARCNRVSG
jgi:hypothetical protein